MTAGNAKHQAAATATREHIIGLRAEIATELAKLLELARMLEDLTSTRQATGIGFMTEETRQLATRQALEDRRANLGLSDRNTTLGQAWMNNPPGTAPGVTAAAATIAPTSMLAEILFTLQDWTRKLGRPALLAALEAEQTEAEDASVCTWPRRPIVATRPTTDASCDELARHLENALAGHTNRLRLEAILRDLEQLHDRAADVVYGPSRTNLPEPCPWCGRPTLVVHHRIQGLDAQVIRCDGRHRCECTHDFCECHRNPTRNRHEWVNSGRATHTWHELSNLQTTRRELLVLETKALDALERIRELHQPTWHYSDGDTAPAYIYIAGDGPIALPESHECVPDVNLEWMTVKGCHDVDEITLHAVPVCTTCGTAGVHGDLDDAVIYPCPTVQALQVDDQTTPGSTP